ncbi:MAG TPA: PBP1A family penicillin-binding protein [Candidatus Krumholzibacteria bacterium]|nr:PBP1A family penicillin-binding protein [Candidatus Krumholzibacteria bacterium]HPD71400.1 PBP1A family penicillin-binding protein [Candidatus Krumholzibacteria bacterium]HRY38900.1 PBP1A family penicillin-binding protein [Candidatus Krumholzibacteria bacterium]
MPHLLSRTIPRRWVRRLLGLFLLLFVAMVLLSLVVLDRLSQNLPSIEMLRNIQPSEKTVLFAADGDTLEEFYTQNRTVVALERIPIHLQVAVVSVEDRRFHEHYGIDLRRLVKIVLDNLAGRGRPGASTVTMQLARNLFPKVLPSEKTVVRKIREMILAVEIEKIYTKDEILAMYLNQIYLGRGTYGVQAAARLFFGKDVWDLEPAESTMIAGMIQLPERYSPFNHLEEAYQRRAVVLNAMVSAGKISRASAEAIAATKVVVADPAASQATAGFAAYFVEEVRKHLEQTYGADRLYTQGLRVWTTLVPRYQTWLEDAAAAHTAVLESEFEYPMTKARYDLLVAAGQRPPKAAYLQCAGLLQDVRTGAILAMMGGRDFADTKWNNAWQALRQPGSVFKPFVYLTALERGYTPASILLDTPFVLDTGASLWRPKNFSDRFRGPVTLRFALSRSINTPTAKLYLDFGLQPLLDNVHRLGITGELPLVPALFLGAGEVSLREVVGAYATFANHGVRVDQYLITRVETLDGEVLEQARIRQYEVLDPAEAYLMTDLLQTALREGTGRAARWRGFTKTGAGKTGTTNESTNAWFCGYTPSYCAGVWIGFEEPQPMGRNATGAHMALPIWAEFMGKIADEKGNEPFVRPPAMTEKLVCLRTGLLATAVCDSTTVEVFLPGSYPQAICSGDHRGEFGGRSGFDSSFDDLDDPEGDGGY